MHMYADFRKCFNLPPDLQDSAHANFVAWERLRMYFNGTLIAIVIATLLTALLTVSWRIDIEPFLEMVEALVTQSIIGLLVVNIGFSQGPVIEGYLVTLGGKNRGDTRLFLFLFALICCSFVALGIGGTSMSAD
jgi:hypothetical protein